MLNRILQSIVNVWRLVTGRERAEVAQSRAAIEDYLVRRGAYKARSGRDRRRT